MYRSFTRLGVVGSTVLLAQVLGWGGSAFAVPSDVVAWESIDQKITVFKDAVDSEVFWFVPKIRFESSGGKTLLVPRTLANGRTEYTTRIIPYFPKDLRNLVAANIPNIRSNSQLQPVVAKDIGFSLPDFGYKFMSPTVTDYQYLDVPRLVRFQLQPDDAALFDRLYADDLGVTVEFTISYDGMTTDKFYNISVSCKQIKNVLDTSYGGSAAAPLPNGIVLGADLQTAFLRTVENSANNVNVVSAGEVPGMQEMLSRVMNTCFTPVDSQGYPATGGYNPYGGYGTNPNCTDPLSTDPSCTTTNPSGTNPYGTNPYGTNPNGTNPNGTDPNGPNPNCTDPNSTDPSCMGTPTGNLLPKAQLGLRFKYRSGKSNVDNQTVAKSVSLKTSTSTMVLVDHISAKATTPETLQVKGSISRNFTVTATNGAEAPVHTGIRVKSGDQITISAAFVFGARASGSKAVWDSSWGKPDRDLYYRVGSGTWVPVNGRAIIASDVSMAGELQFYLDRSSIFNRIPEKARKGNIFTGATYTVDSISPSFKVEVTGRDVAIR